MFQSTPSAKIQWRHENGYSQPEQSRKANPPTPHDHDPDPDADAHPDPDPDHDPMSMPVLMPMSMYMSLHVPMSMSMPMSMPALMSVSVSVSGRGILADYLLGQGEPSTSFTRLLMSQSTPPAETEWRQGSGYSQQILSLKKTFGLSSSPLPSPHPRHDQTCRRPTCSIPFSPTQSPCRSWLRGSPRPHSLPPPR